MIFEEQPWLLVPIIIVVVEAWNGAKWWARRWWESRRGEPAGERTSSP